jgi:hypothetical protein
MNHVTCLSIEARWWKEFEEQGVPCSSIVEGRLPARLSTAP